MGLITTVRTVCWSNKLVVVMRTVAARLACSGVNCRKASRSCGRSTCAVNSGGAAVSVPSTSIFERKGGVSVSGIAQATVRLGPHSVAEAVPGPKPSMGGAGGCLSVTFTRLAWISAPSTGLAPMSKRSEAWSADGVIFWYSSRRGAE